MVRQVRLLGGVSATTDLGEQADIGPAKCQALLAALAVSPGKAIPVWRLTDLVWGEEPPRTAERTLQSYVTRLRKALGPDSIVRTGAAYRLDVAADAVDVIRFQRRLDAGDIDAALAEWTGVPLAGLVVPGLTATVDGLVEQWLTAVETDLARRVEVDAPTVIGRLTELTAVHPYREGLWALLMTALYRAGRQADALAAYRTARQNLIEHLGVEPGPALREVESLVLDHDERLLDGRTTGRLDGNLPRRPGRLIGRDEALTTIGDTLAAVPVVTLVGPGGIGKTRLAVAAAARRADVDEVWLIELAEIASSSDVPRAVADPLDIKEVPAQDLSQSIVMALRTRRALLVLDNCEHVIDGAAALAQAIADGCPAIQILATSREGLGLRHGHEHLIAVQPLDPAGPGAELFNERASAVCHDFDPGRERQAVEEICRRLDGVPLAIELAAARITSFTPADLLQRLDDHLRLLIGGGRASAERHRTLRATIGWSYDLLSSPQQRLFQQLSVFVGPFDLAAAETIAADEGMSAAAADDLLGDLVMRSMLVVERGPSGRRFRLLETMRQFAAERLAETGGTDLAAERHARWCLDRVTTIGRLLAGPAEIEGAARLDELWPNLRAAFDWACSHDDRHLAHALVRPVAVEVVRRNRGELGDWIERLLAITPSSDIELIVFGLMWVAQRYKVGQDPSAYDRLALRHGEPDHPLVHHARASAHQEYAAMGRWAEPAIAELRRRGEHDLAEQFEIDVAAGLVLGERPGEGDVIIAALIERYRAQGPPTLLHLSLVLLGYSAMLQGENERAERLFDEAVGVPVPERTQSPSKTIEARAAFQRGNRIQAYRILSSFITELLDSGNIQAICVTCVEFVNMMTKAGRLAEAALILRHLDKSFPYWAPLVAGAKEQLTARGGLHQVADQTIAHQTLGDREALEYMRGILEQLASSPRHSN